MVHTVNVTTVTATNTHVDTDVHRPGGEPESTYTANTVICSVRSASPMRTPPLNNFLGGSGTTTLHLGPALFLRFQGARHQRNNDFASVNSLTLSGTLINNATIDLQGESG